MNRALVQFLTAKRHTFTSEFVDERIDRMLAHAKLVKQLGNNRGSVWIGHNDSFPVRPVGVPITDRCTTGVDSGPGFLQHALRGLLTEIQYVLRAITTLIP